MLPHDSGCWLGKISRGALVYFTTTDKITLELGLVLLLIEKYLYDIMT